MAKALTKYKSPLNSRKRTASQKASRRDLEFIATSLQNAKKAHPPGLGSSSWSIAKLGSAAIRPPANHPDQARSREVPRRQSGKDAILGVKK